MDDDQAAIQELKRSVQALAAEPADQPGLFPPFACVACELLGDFENWYGATIWRQAFNVTSGQRAALEAVRDASTQLGATPCFSSVELGRADWVHLRESAARCLSEFGWVTDLPSDGRSAYIQGG